MKTAVSIPDRLFAAAERYARRHGMPRSQVYAEAIERLIAEEESEEDLTATLNAVCEAVDGSLDDFGLAAAKRGLADSEW